MKLAGKTASDDGKILLKLGWLLVRYARFIIMMEKGTFTDRRRRKEGIVIKGHDMKRKSIKCNYVEVILQYCVSVICS